MSKVYQTITYYVSFVIKGNLYFKLLLVGTFQILLVFQVTAQDSPALSPKDLLQKIKTSRPDTNRISLQLQLGSYYLFKPGEYKNDLDSAVNFFKQAAQLSVKLHENDWHYKALGMIGNYYSEMTDWARCKEYFVRIAGYYHQTGNVEKEANAWNTLANLYDITPLNGHTQDKIRFYQRARSLYLQDHDQLNAITALKGIASIHVYQKKYDLAEKMLQQVLTEYKTLGFKELHHTYDLLQSLEYVRGNYTRAVAYNLEAIKYMRASGDTSLATRYYYFLAKSYYTSQKYREALPWARKVAASKDSNSDIKTVLVQILLQLNMTKEAGIALNKLIATKANLSFSDTLSQYRVAALYYDKINRNDMAIQYYKKILNLKFNINYAPTAVNIWTLVCNIELARIHLEINQVEKAANYINNTSIRLKTSKIPLEPGYWLGHYNNLYLYDMAKGNYRQAIKDLALRDHIKDSLFTAAKDKQVAELNIKYETTQKEQSIKDLQNQRAVQQARLDKANLQRNITIGGGLLLLIVAGAAYNGYRAKQRSNLKLIAKQQQINTQNATLQHLLSEKDWLLKEVHHRVKNNLHTVICLLEAQARNLENDALEAIENSQHRIYAMSLIHQKLYQSDDIKTINMAEYVPELVQSLEDSFGISDQVKFKLNIDPINLTLSQAIPLGLILNEAVTNAIKYAFPDTRNGEISISMMDDRNLITLKIVDNGIGMSLFDRETEPESMGLRLMNGLSEDIEATINFEIDNGTIITIVFKPDTLSDMEGFLRSTENKEEFI
ncbi:hypothetical protein EZ428_12365 [Pedobacter frigiditerrae]|uniref:histidine kinase n=1 Tax=Pedobacter frigiditerrae TaxID=2530452 RepID=A0A4V6N5Q3_9SPHI|nr:histidine kinase dimerization/phosphoacceptor domain -containing protein [Pedobacter frigiditerrae]TCC90076.1 hypothetical protein EZ428_12365 [Pedobacter frigiditerrae]